MCDCNKTYTAKNTISMVSKSYRVTEASDCEFTMDQLEGWKDKLICFKDKGLYKTYNVTPALLNRYIGVVLSAINLFPKSPCAFQNQLNEIETFMVVVNNTNC